MSVEGVSSPSAGVAAAWADAALAPPAEAGPGAENSAQQPGALAPTATGGLSAASVISAMAALSEAGALDRLLGARTDSAAHAAHGGLHGQRAEATNASSSLAAQALLPTQENTARVQAQAQAQAALPSSHTVSGLTAPAQPGLALDMGAALALGAGAMASPAAPPLVPQLPTGLQANPTLDPGWAFTATRTRPEPSRPEVTTRSRPDIELPDDGSSPDQDQAGADRDDKPEDEPDADLEWQDSAPEADWCTPLNQALRTALAAKPLPEALAAAAEQWRLGRCVVLACPQGADFTGPAWAHVLWPRQRGRRLKGQRQGAALPALHGVRVEAALSWAALPPQGWCHVRAVKQHHPRLGRQLLAIAPQADSVNGAQAQLQASSGLPVPCEVQLGPIRANAPRWLWACIRIHAVRPFWAALGAQWSAHVLVSVRPLVAEPAASFKETP